MHSIHQHNTSIYVFNIIFTIQIVFVLFVVVGVCFEATVRGSEQTAEFHKA